MHYSKAKKSTKLTKYIKYMGVQYSVFNVHCSLATPATVKIPSLMQF